MGREIRRVPPNWEHPKHEKRDGDSYKPLYDQTYEDARQEWLEGLAKWEAGLDPDREKYTHEDGSYYDFWEWGDSPPNREYYREYKDDEATWYQVYETVSEGTPVTPPFETEDELVNYLIENGDFWDQQRWSEGNRLMQPNPPGYTREQAEAFVKGAGWVPSMTVQNGKITAGIAIAAEIEGESA
jgi:hypothetical protein